MKKIKSKIKYILGIDEVGRGPIAGPVAVGAFVFLKSEAQILFEGVKESKQLTEERRQKWFTEIKKAQSEGLIDFYVSFQSEKVIDKKGINFAISKCLKNSLNKLRLENSINPTESLVLLDGGLEAPKEFINQKTIIRGDEKEMVIALASICAKSIRDRKMTQLAQIHSNYGFEKHKGYGTKSHYEAIKKHGLSTIHRRSFLPKSYN